MSAIPGICLDASPRLITQGYDAGRNTGTGMYSGPGIQPDGLFTPSQTGAGNFSLRYKFVTTAGCTDSTTGSITVWPRPTAAFIHSPVTCVQTPVTFTDQSIANANTLTKWQWNFGDGTSQTLTSGNPFTKTFGNAQLYKVSLTVTTDSGCNSLPFAMDLDMHPKPVVNFNMPATVCLPGEGDFRQPFFGGRNRGTPMTYFWNFGLPGANSTQDNPTWYYNAVGPYTIFLKATSARGCADSLSKQFNNVVPQPMANWSATPPEVCLGAEIQFADLSNPLNNTISAWNWNFGDGSFATQKSPSHIFSTSGTFKVSMYYATGVGCFSDTLAKNIIVHPYPVVDAGPDLFLLQGGQLSIRATASGSSNYTYLWTPDTWLSDAAILQPLCRAEDDITYTLTVAGEGGCARSDDVFVKLLLKPVIPNAFSPNGDAVNDTWIIRYLDSYPGATVQIFDRYGKRILMSTGYNNPWDGTMGGSPVPAGVYYFIVDPKNGLKPISGSLTLIR